MGKQNEIRIQIKLLHGNDVAASKIAVNMGISVKSVYRIISELWRRKQFISQRSGRPRSTFMREDRFIMKQIF